MPKNFKTIFGLAGVACATLLASPAAADKITASCTTVNRISNGEANVLYYEAEGELGSQEAGRLWSIYHQLKRQCASNPNGKIVVSIDQKTRSFLKARL